MVTCGFNRRLGITVEYAECVILCRSFDYVIYEYYSIYADNATYE
jgi:hypothetical protein